MKDNGQAEERRVLAALVHLPPGPVSCSKLAGMLDAPPGRAELKQLLNGLGARGVVQLLRSATGEVKVCPSPDRLADLHRDTFGPLPACGVKVQARHGDTSPDLTADMITLFGLIHAERPVLNKNGGLPKRLCDAWLRKLTLDNEAAGRMVGGRKAMLPLPEALAVVLDLLVRGGLVHLRQGQLVPDEAAMVRMMGKSDADMRAGVYRLWLAAFLPVHGPARHVAVLLPETDGAWICRDGTEAAWRDGAAEYGLADAGLPAARNCRDGAPDEWEPAWREELSALQQAGWIVCGETAEGRPAFRWNRPLCNTDRSCGLATAIREKPLFVQPDLELLLPASHWYALHDLLAGFADMAARDRLQVYRLTEQSVQRALARGWTGAAIEAVLRLTAAGDVPAEVAGALRDWEKAHGRFRMEPACLLRFATPEAAEPFVAIEALAPLLRADNRLGDAAYVLTEAEWEAFRQTAEKLGLAPQAGGTGTGSKGQTRKNTDKTAKINQVDKTGKIDKIRGTDDGNVDYRPAVAEAYLHDGETPGVPEPGESGPVALHSAGPRHVESASPSVHAKAVPAQGLFPAPLQPAGYVPATGWSRDELFPGLAQIPAAWWKERRSYHPATMRNMLETALSWGCRVEVTRKDGRSPAAGAAESFTFVVTSLAEDGNGSWRVCGHAGRADVDAGVEELADMRLFLPGVSPVSAKNNT